MTIDLTPEELDIDALEERCDGLRKITTWRGRRIGPTTEHHRYAERCAALSKRLGKLAKEVGR